MLLPTALVALCCLIPKCETATVLSNIHSKQREPEVTPIDIATTHNAAYVAAGEKGVFIFDLTAAGGPQLKSTLDTIFSAEKVFVHNNELYVGTPVDIASYGLRQWDNPDGSGRNKNMITSKKIFIGAAGEDHDQLFMAGSAPNNRTSLAWYTHSLSTVFEFFTEYDISDADGSLLGWVCWSTKATIFMWKLNEVAKPWPPWTNYRTYFFDEISGITAFKMDSTVEHIYLAEGTVCFVFALGQRTPDFPGSAGSSSLVKTLTFPTTVADVELVGNMLFVLTADHIYVYSIAVDHSSPVFVRMDPTGSTRNRRIISTTTGTYIQHNSLVKYDPASVLGFVEPIPLPAVYAPRLTSSATHVFKASSPYGIEVLDRNTLQRVGFYSHPHAILGMAEKVVGNRLYFASSEVFTLDVRNPAAPLLLEIYSQHGVEDMYVEGSTLYLACGSAGLVILDTENSPMRRLSVFDTPGTAKAVTVSGTTAYIADGTSLQVVEVCDPASPVLLGMVSIAGARDVEVVGKTAYIADDRNMVVVDVKTPAAPSLVRTYQHGTSSFAMAVTQQAAFLTTSTTISTVDISSPQGPSFAGHTAISTTAQPTVHVSGPFLFIADMHHGLQRLTITDTIASFSGSEVGCLHEVTANNYILPVRKFFTTMTSVQCASLCSSAKFTHSGLRTMAASVECCCGEAADFVGSIRSEASGCSAVDSGRIAVRSAVPVHVGCYVDDIAARKLKFEESGNSVTVSRCAGLCQAKGKAYSGVQGGDSCYCGDDIGTQKLAPAADCSFPCLGDPQQKCGANLRNAISILKPVSLTLEVQTGTGDYSQSAHSFPVEVEYWDGSVQIVGSVVAPARGSTTLFTIPTAAVLPREVRLKEQGGDGWNVKHVKFYGPTTTAVKWRVDGATGMWIKDQEGHRLGVWVAP